MQDLEQHYSAHLKTCLARYRAAANEAGKDGILIAAGSLKIAFLDDHNYPFKVNPHFKSLVPITEVPDSFILLRGNDKPLLLFNQPQDYWHKTPEDPTGVWVEHWDIQPIGTLADAHNHLGDISRLAYIGEETDIAKGWGFDLINDEQMFTNLHHDRGYKTDYEIACLLEANKRAFEGHQSAETCFRSGGSEFDIQHAYLAAIQHREQQAPYSGIVALNDHAAVLHYQHYEYKRYEANNLHSLLIDAGADCHGYASDITRTYAYRPGTFADMITAMDEAQLSLIDTIALGVDYVGLNAQMHLKLAEILKQFDIVRMDPAAMVEENITFTFMPHGLGHFLGLQVHDVGGFRQEKTGKTKAAPNKYPALRLTRPIEDRQVFTIEPGLYFIPMLLDKLRQTEFKDQVNWSLIETLLPCGGIRIEDNIAMIDGKTHNLTRQAFSL